MGRIDKIDLKQYLEKMRPILNENAWSERTKSQPRYFFIVQIWALSNN